jgi:hypothetical protein
MVEIVGVVGEIRLHDVRPAVAIVVGSIDAHAGLLAPVGTVSYTRFGADLRESALAAVVVKQAGRGIVRHVEIEAAIFIVVEPQHAETVIPIRIDGSFRDVGESAVAIVV